MNQISEEVLQRRCKLKGYCAGQGYVLTWRPSIIPYYLELWFKCIPEKWDHTALLKADSPVLDTNPSTWRAAFEPSIRESLLHSTYMVSGEAKMPSYDHDTWWHAIADDNARKNAYILATKINRDHASIKDLTPRQAEEVALEAQNKPVNMSHLETLVKPTFQGDKSAEYPGRGVPDEPEIKAKVDELEKRRKREGDADASITGTFETPNEAAQPDPALTSGRRARADSVKFIRERTSSRATTPTKATFPQAGTAKESALTDPRPHARLPSTSFDREELYRQAQMTSRRLGEYERSKAALRLKPLAPSGGTTTASPAPAPGPLVQGTQPGLSRRERDPNGGFMNISWGYATHTRADQEMLKKGILLFEKLPTCYRDPPSNIDADMLDRPLIVNPKFIMDRGPSIHFDDLEPTIHMLPFTRVRPDARANSVGHPDYLGPSLATRPVAGLVNLRLSQYQSCEFFGQPIYRHDRDLLSCHFPGCRITLSDYSESQFLCLGCGPKSTVRYCCRAHMLGDTVHWKECGSKDLLIKRVIDHTTEPSRFWRFCPAIVDRSQWQTPERHRQRNHAMLTAGHYTLFHDMINAEYNKSLPPMIIQFPKEHPEYKELTARVERLLNLLFFDKYNRAATSYLYRLLRHALQLTEKWNPVYEYDLCGQLMGEFGITDNLPDEKHPLCDCLWSPKDIKKHHPECPSSLKHRHVSGELVFHGDTNGGLKEHAEKMEARYWILRAWRQQHEAIYWRLRVGGLKFPGVTVPKAWPHPYLGAGWEGYGATTTDMHEAWMEDGWRAGDDPATRVEP